MVNAKTETHKEYCRFDYQFDLKEALQEAQLDRENNIIRGVQIFNNTSKNGRTYSDAAKLAVEKLAEGLPMFLNHGTMKEFEEFEGIRDMRNMAAVIRNPRTSGNRVLADISINPEYSDKLFWIAKDRPLGAGLSIVSPYMGYTMDKDMVKEITKLESIDLVSKAGMATSLFESEHSEDTGGGTEAEPDNTEQEKANMEVKELEAQVKALETEKAALLKEKDEAVKLAESYKAKDDRRKALLTECKEKIKPKFFSIAHVEAIDAIAEVENEDARKRIAESMLGHGLTQKQSDGNTSDEKVTLTGKESKDGVEAMNKAFASIGL